MKKFGDLQKLETASIYQGSSNKQEYSLVLLDYTYGQSQLYLKIGEGNWFEVPFGLSGSFTARKVGEVTQKYNQIKVGLDSLYQKKVSIREFSTLEIYQDGPAVLLTMGREFVFLQQINLDLKLVKFEPAPVVYELKAAYEVVGYPSNIFQLKNLKYSSTYNSAKFFFNQEEWSIKSYQTYRDGGTTEIELIDLEGNAAFFHQDTPFKKDNRQIYLDWKDRRLTLVPLLLNSNTPA